MFSKRALNSPKPHIFSPFWSPITKKPIWVCAGKNMYFQGGSPVEAGLAWEKWRRDVETGTNIQDNYTDLGQGQRVSSGPGKATWVQMRG